MCVLVTFCGDRAAHVVPIICACAGWTCDIAIVQNGASHTSSLGNSRKPSRMPSKLRAARTSRGKTRSLCFWMCSSTGSGSGLCRPSWLSFLRGSSQAHLSHLKLKPLFVVRDAQIAEVDGDMCGHTSRGPRRARQRLRFLQQLCLAGAPPACGSPPSVRDEESTTATQTSTRPLFKPQDPRSQCQ